MKKRSLVLISLLIFLCTKAQVAGNMYHSWRVTLERKDGKLVPFILEEKIEKGNTVLYVINAEEKIQITNLETDGDSIFFLMPTFESNFRVKRQPNGDLEGTYIKGTSGKTQYWPMHAYNNVKNRFDDVHGKSEYNISGKWEVSITRANGTIRKAVAMFEQKGNKITGSFLTPSADYRYLEGIVKRDSLFMSGFDGDNIHLFEAQIKSENKISGGVFYNGYTSKESWTAEKNNAVALPQISDATSLRAGFKKLDFSFRDLKGNLVSINDEKYKNKVVVIQLMGSWCANCLDETRFLSNYYNTTRPKDVEIIALAYEFTTDRDRSIKSVARFQKLFNVKYPILITGVAASDDQKTEKTLPQLTTIKSFPTTIFIDKKGHVSEIHTQFYGPGSGEYYIESKNKFYETVQRLLKE